LGLIELPDNRLRELRRDIRALDRGGVEMLLEMKRCLASANGRTV
jgi:hypothetical protein